MQNSRDLTDTSKQQTESSLEFVHTLSHAFKTPLTVIKLYADLMLNDLGRMDSDTQHRYLSAIKASTYDLNFLLANALNFQKISGAEMDWRDEEADIVKLIAGAAYPIETACRTKGIPFAFNSEFENLVTLIDAERLAQVVYNLLANSLQLADKDGIDIGLSANDTPAGKRVHLTIGHHGREIPAEQLQLMMEPSKPADETGDGKTEEMGLHIAKHIVEHYQGRLWAENRPEKVSRFHVELPLRQAG